jgi:hypothetical protein
MNNLTPEQIERLACLAEEATEVAKAAMKIIRYGFTSEHPSCPGMNNREQLAKELGDLRAIMAIMVQAKELYIWDYQKFAVDKLGRVQEYLHWQENKDLAQTALDIHNGHG